MATGGGSGEASVVVNFEGNKTVLHLPKNLMVGIAVQKAADAFKQDPRGLSFLYHGVQVPNDTTVGDTLAEAASYVTTIHLIRSGKTATITRDTIKAVRNEPTERLYGFCKACKCLIVAREVFRCSTPECTNPTLFRRSSVKRLDYYKPVVKTKLLTGSCDSCGKRNIQASVQFECTACDDGTTVCLLRQIRDNVNKRCCIKCGEVKPVVFKFFCRAKHTLCLECFSQMCKQHLGAGKFRSYVGVGFSVGCPGPGEDCQHIPVLDPHHFKIVDVEQVFYKKFIKLSIELIQPLGDKILCSCTNIIDPQQQKNIEPNSDKPIVSEQKWYRRLFRSQRNTPPRTRRRVSCRQCDRQYCVDCKQFWHEGNCARVNKNLEAEIKYNKFIEQSVRSEEQNDTTDKVVPDRVEPNPLDEDITETKVEEVTQEQQSDEAEVDENQKHLDAVKQAMEDKGSLDHTLMQAVFLGPARSGKSSLIDRLTGGEPAPLSPSTGVAEEPVHVQVRRSKSFPLSVTDSIWFKLTYKSEARELLLSISHSFSRSKETEAQEAHTSVESDSDFPEAEEIADLSPEVPTHVSQEVSQESNSSSASLPEGYKSPFDILRAVVSGEDINEYFEKSWSLYLTDTGGQMEFQDLLPLLVSGPSVFFITFRLDQDLNQVFTIQYELPGGNKSQPYQTTLTVMEAILQSLASISSMGTFVYKGLQKQEIPIRPKVFLVGTHKDLLDPETAVEQIHKVDQYLQSIITSTSHYHDGLVEFATPSQLIFTVNNLAPGDTDFQKIRLAVEKLVHRGEFKVSSPSHWLILSLVIRYLKSRIISFDECFSVAQQCGITDETELKEALHFLHTKLGVVRYFPVEGLDNIVIKDPQVLFDKVTELIVRTFTFDNVGKYSSDEFTKKGIFSLRDFERVSGDSNPLLTPAQLVKLLQHLRIVAPFQTKDGDTKYFIPCILNHTKDSEENVVSQQSEIPPLVVTFKCGYCPKGIAGALIKYLLTNEMLSELEWKLQLDEIFRDQVSIRVGPDFDTIIVKILPTHIKIACIPNFQSTNRTCSIEEICDEVRLSVENGVEKVATDMNYLFNAKHTITFDCQCDVCSKDQHPAEMSWYERRPSKLQCQQTQKCIDLPAGCLVWFGQPLQTPLPIDDAAQLNSSSHSTSDSYQGTLNSTHLSEIYRLLLPLASEWHNIGILLNMSDGVLKTIREDNPRKSTNCLREMFGTWLKQINPHPTWLALSRAIEPFDPRLSEEIKNRQ